LSDDDRIKEIERELWELRQGIKAKRKAAHKVEGKVAAAFEAALKIVDQQKAAGVPFEERMRGLEGVLRAVWPQTRAWHYDCDACQDTGLVMHVCRRGARCNGISTRIDGPHSPPGKYRRLCFTNAESDYEHDYGEPCFCKNGARFREKPPAKPDDFSDAGKAKSMTRIGRK